MEKKKRQKAEAILLLRTVSPNQSCKFRLTILQRALYYKPSAHNKYHLLGYRFKGATKISSHKEGKCMSIDLQATKLET